MIDMHIPYEAMIRVVSKRHGLVIGANEILVDVDRSHPVLGNRHVMQEESDRHQVCTLFAIDLAMDREQNGPMTQAINRLADDVRAGNYLALRCWCAPKECHADHIRTAIIRKLDEHH